MRLSEVLDARTNKRRSKVAKGLKSASRKAERKHRNQIMVNTFENIVVHIWSIVHSPASGGGERRQRSTLTESELRASRYSEAENLVYPGPCEHLTTLHCTFIAEAVAVRPPHLGLLRFL